MRFIWRATFRNERARYLRSLSAKKRSADGLRVTRLAVAVNILRQHKNLLSTRLLLLQLKEKKKKKHLVKARMQRIYNSIREIVTVFFSFKFIHQEKEGKGLRERAVDLSVSVCPSLSLCIYIINTRAAAEEREKERKAKRK